MIDTIKAKLARLCQPGYVNQKTGRSSKTGFLNPPLSGAEVSAFESAHQVILPEGYRRFITEIGNGGIGPEYGLNRLEESLVSQDSGFLARPFPYTAAWNLTPDGFDTVPDFEADYFDQRHTQGTLRVCHTGCGYYDLLVVSGPQRGFMWADGRASDQGLARCTGVNYAPLDFLGWYDIFLLREGIR